MVIANGAAELIAADAGFSKDRAVAKFECGCVYWLTCHYCCSQQRPCEDPISHLAKTVKTRWTHHISTPFPEMSCISIRVCSEHDGVDHDNWKAVENVYSALKIDDLIDIGLPVHVKCDAVTQSGQKCKRTAVKSYALCAIHREQAASNMVNSILW